MTTTEADRIADLAALAPRGETYETLKARYTDGTLGAYLAALTPRERLGCAALNAEHTGREMTTVLRMFETLENAALDAIAPTLPEAPELLARLYAASAASADPALQRACGRAAAAIVEGVAIDLIPEGLRCASRTDPERISIVNNDNCTCPARGMCWHEAIWRVL